MLSDDVPLRAGELLVHNCRSNNLSKWELRVRPKGGKRRQRPEWARRVDGCWGRRADHKPVCCSECFSRCTSRRRRRRSRSGTEQGVARSKPSLSCLVLETIRVLVPQPHHVARRLYTLEDLTIFPVLICICTHEHPSLVLAVHLALWCKYSHYASKWAMSTCSIRVHMVLQCFYNPAM